MKTIKKLILLMGLITTLNSFSQYAMVKNGQFNFIKSISKTGEILNHFGFIALNDSIIIVNIQNDSCYFYNIYTRAIVHKENFILKSNYNLGDNLNRNKIDKISDSSGTYIWIKQNDIGYMIKINNKNFKEILRYRVEVQSMQFTSLNGNIYLLTTGGDFYNASSSVPNTLPSGVVCYNNNGNLIYSIKILGQTQDGPGLFSPFILSNSNQLIVGCGIDRYIGVQVNKVIVGNLEINYKPATQVNTPYCLIQLDSKLNFIKNTFYEGIAKGAYNLNKDTIVIYGTSTIMKLRNLGEVSTTLAPDFHYKVNYKISDSTFSDLCIMTGNQGAGGYTYVVGVAYPPQCYFDKIGNSEFYYLPFRGTILFTSPYTSLGGQNFLTGISSDKCGIEESKSSFFGSLYHTWAYISKGDKNVYVAVYYDPKLSYPFYMKSQYKDTGFYILAINEKGQIHPDSISKGAHNSTGVSKIYKKNYLEVYPIPATDFISVNGNGNLLGRNYRIMDLYGKIVLIGKFENNNILIYELPSGVYILNIDNQNQSIKIIKR